MRARCIVIFLLLFASFPARSQSVNFIHYQVENGLSNNAVICTWQDRQGFMWFGTKDGLNRFDGYTFRVFRHDPQQPGSIGGNYIAVLWEDNDGLLYVGTDKGLYVYNPATEAFKAIPAKPGIVLAIDKDPDGNIWFSVDLKLYRYNPRNGALIAPAHYPSASNLCRAADGNIWLSSPEGQIAVYNKQTDRFTAYPLYDHSPPVTSTWITKMVATGQDTILVGTTTQGLKVFNTRLHTYQDQLTLTAEGTGTYVRDFLRRGPDEYWIATESGIYIYHPSNGSYINLRKKYNDPYSISDNAVYTLYRDREGGIWAGTYFGGVNYFTGAYTAFEKFFPRTGENALGGNAVREICADRYGQLWIGTEDGGLNKMDIRSGNISNIRPLPGGGGLSHTNLHGLLVTGDTLWIGTFEHGLDLLNVRTGKFFRHYSAGNGPYDLHSNFIYSITQDRQGDVLFCTSRGLYRYTRERDGFIPVKEVPGYIFYTCLYQDSEGTYWAGTTRDGLYHFNPHTGKKGVYLFSDTDSTSLPNNRVDHILEDSRYQLWCATEGGLCRLDKSTGRFVRYTTHNGLLSNMTYNLLEDDQHDLWITTSKGLAHLHPASGAIKVYTKANGLLNDQFNYNSAYKDSCGTLYFGSVKGMIRFNPASLPADSYVPPVYLTGFQVFNKPLLPGGPELARAINYTDTITLAYDQSSFSIDFAALRFNSPETTPYAYKMEGLDKDWTYLETNRKAVFTKLSPGTYHFLVKAANNSGQWTSAPRQLTIRILPPFWASYPAYVLYLVTLCSLVWYIVRHYRIRNRQQQQRRMELLEHEKEKELYQAKIEFFTHIAHEIRTPLTLIKGPMEKVIQRSAEVPQIQKNLLIMERNTNRLLDLTNQLLDFRSTEINGYKLNFVKAPVPALLQEIHLQFIPAAEQKELQFRIALPVPHFFAYVDLEAFHKIVSNLVSNAIKYAAGTVLIELLPVEENDQYFTIHIQNDGVLIPSEMKEKIFEPFFRGKSADNQPGTGLGLSIARSLVQLHQGTLTLQYAHHRYNVFVLTLPIHQEIEFNLSKWKNIS
ncbi:ligand-binding sensor domain-containing protein [Chitinophaga qingshengii]|uniref:histidine kinase n=1 Tax=Chitinophaga qingshengii TaxID=1569794 RepID=A0ABR7TTH6_9BACT|nr:sensor histidine kinase [Chitinophaga qingshengii]MBC9932274.1 histidine kinase [Chitinophaga qingshengii]